MNVKEIVHTWVEIHFLFNLNKYNGIPQKLKIKWVFGFHNSNLELTDGSEVKPTGYSFRKLWFDPQNSHTG